VHRAELRFLWKLDAWGYAQMAARHELLCEMRAGRSLSERDKIAM